MNSYTCLNKYIETVAYHKLKSIEAQVVIEWHWRVILSYLKTLYTHNQVKLQNLSQTHDA